MKISKSLLQAIAVGLTMGATTSCSYLEDTNSVTPNHPSDDSTEQQTCDDTEKGEENPHTWSNCPACGLG
ncbi:MAG: hypothetical protein GYB31_03760 [Bacteroidetes bacterium]|nr:hypothetical protein [Bacteroidota bacterium]